MLDVQGLGRGKCNPFGKCWALMPKHASRIILLPGVCSWMSCKTCTWGFQAAKCGIGMVEHGVCKPPEPSSTLSWVKLWNIFVSSCTPGNRQSSRMLWAGTLLFLQDNPTMSPAQSNISGVFQLVGRMAPRTDCFLSKQTCKRLIRRSGNLPKALDMVGLLWNTKSWELFAAAAWKLTWSKAATKRDVYTSWQLSGSCRVYFVLETPWAIVSKN